MPTEDILKEAAGQLKDIINARNVMGEAIDMGNRMIIPVTRFGIGFGAGGSVSDAKGDAGGKGGAGGAIEPIAVIITDKEISGVEGIQIISLKNNNPIAQVITALSETLVPQVIDLIKKRDSNKLSSDSENIEPASQ